MWYLKKKYLLPLLLLISTPLQADTIPNRMGLWKRIKQQTAKFIDNFSNVDTNYIEPQRYHFTVMLQNTNTYDQYILKNDVGQSIKLSPSNSIKVGPYVGYHWIFLGYTIDLKNIEKNKDRTEIDLSLYSSMLGIDLFYRKTGRHHQISSLFLNDNINTKPLEGIPFSGFQASIKGIYVYYIFNHKKFSYPAAFSQSTIQRKSAGSALLGFGYATHQININLPELNSVVSSKLHLFSHTLYASNTLLNFDNYQYTDISVSGGYSYNWVFAHNWVFASSLSLALGYKYSKGDMLQNKNKWIDYHVKNFNIDTIGRFGLVWNNSKWYAGCSAIVRNFNYNKNQLTSNTLFGNLNIYVGMNFGRIKTK